ncbi:hypothetical protein AGLY_015087 [Aphis glycines]|uniref:Uncharacterized protein n=1 Tax=Aphis glycines TaxID=307491 RepID=A0A6G0T1P0_APHGL|nr:hypothetical protein AGLY_015087 [Aphis glycines]
MSLARRSNKNKGGGLINTLLNKLPVELHVTGYQYCGPVRGDKGINPLNAAYREHGRSNSSADRNEADHILEQRAWERFKSKDSGFKEKAVAWDVTTAMKAKRKVGCGCGFKAAVKTKVPRIVDIPKKGGVLPLIPIFAGSSALGALTGGVANVVKVANEFKRNVPSHLGNGLYLTPYKGNSYKIGYISHHIKMVVGEKKTKKK